MPMTRMIDERFAGRVLYEMGEKACGEISKETAFRLSIDVGVGSRGSRLRL